MFTLLFILLGLIVLLFLSFKFSQSFRIWLLNYLAQFEASIYGLKVYKQNIGELELSYLDSKHKSGDKPVILMVHGFSATKETWARFAKRFIKDYRVIAPDLAGHGQTEFNPDFDYSTPAQCERLKNLLDDLDIDQIHITGNSMGGFIAATFAKMYPQRVLSLGMQDPAGVVTPIDSDMDIMLAAGNNPFEVHNQQEFEKFYAMTTVKMNILPKFLLAVLGEIYINRREEFAIIFAGFYHQDWLDDNLAEITVPTQLQWGDQDRLIDVSGIKPWSAGIANIETKVWEGVGHMPYLEIFAESAQSYQQFLLKH